MNAIAECHVERDRCPVYTAMRVIAGRHGIDPFRATPKRQYYELCGLQWTD